MLCRGFRLVPDANEMAGKDVNAFVFPAGDGEVRRTIAIHRLTGAEAPRRWSVDVNRKNVNEGDLAFLWQTGDHSEMWRPGLWAAGFIYRFDRVDRPHWRDPDLTTQYADLEMAWVPIMDREDLRADALGNGAMAKSVLAAKTQQMRSPVKLRDGECDWLLARIPRSTRQWIEEERSQLALALAY
jgi:hypothetical protein